MDNREIKFRSWDKKKKKMWYDIEKFYDTLGYDEKPTDCDSDFSDFIYSDNQVVMQYTGLTDKNGKEIYEGDIVGYEYSDMWGNSQTARSVVRIEEGLLKPFYVFDTSEKYKISKHDYEVIGNKFEDKDKLPPEL